MNIAPAPSQILPHAMPACPNSRLALFAVRRMGAHGLLDALAAHAMVSGFGEGFRRPLVLMRALMADVATSATGSIAIAPCCCSRMTTAEAALLTIILPARKPRRRPRAPAARRPTWHSPRRWRAGDRNAARRSLR